MCRRLGKSIDAREASAMTTRTLTRHGTGVRHVRRGEMGIVFTVAGIASERCWHMPGRTLASRLGAIVAIHASSGYHAIVVSRRRQPSRRSMTLVTRLIGQIMGRGRRFVTCVYRQRIGAAIMTILTQAPRSGVAHAGRDEPRVTHVASIALSTCRNVSAQRLTSRGRTIVTSRASPYSTCSMRVGSPSPDRSGFMACIALRSRRSVCRRLGIRTQHSNNAVAAMTIGTRTRCTRMGIFRPRPDCRGVMAGITLDGRADVISRLGKCAERNKSTTVAVRTLAVGCRMVHVGRFEAGGDHMTVFARTRGRKMCLLRHGLSLDGCISTAMAIDASAGDSGMAHGGRCEGTEIGMAGVAESSCWDMPTRLGETLARCSVVAVIAGMVTNHNRRIQL